MLSGSLLIHGPPAISGAGCPMRGPPWAPAPRASDSTPAVAAIATATRISNVLALMPSSSRRPPGRAPAGPESIRRRRPRVTPLSTLRLRPDDLGRLGLVGKAQDVGGVALVIRHDEVPVPRVDGRLGCVHREL